MDWGEEQGLRAGIGSEEQGFGTGTGRNMETGIRRAEQGLRTGIGREYPGFGKGIWRAEQGLGGIRKK